MNLRYHFHVLFNLPFNIQYQMQNYPFLYGISPPSYQRILPQGVGVNEPLLHWGDEDGGSSLPITCCHFRREAWRLHLYSPAVIILPNTHKSVPSSSVPPLISVKANCSSWIQPPPDTETCLANWRHASFKGTAIRVYRGQHRLVPSTWIWLLQIQTCSNSLGFLGIM